MRGILCSIECLEKPENPLDRLKTDYIDFYLVHSLMSFLAWTKFRALGFDEFVKENTANGKIRHIGFSWHGSKDDFIKEENIKLAEHMQAGILAHKALYISALNPVVAVVKAYSNFRKQKPKK